jgi:hypothetical protein
MYAVAYHGAQLIGDSAFSGGAVLIDRRESETLVTGMSCEQGEEDQEEEGSVSSYSTTLLNMLPGGLTWVVAVIRSIQINVFLKITRTALQTKKPDGSWYTAASLQQLNPWLRNQFANLVKVYRLGTGLFDMHMLSSFHTSDFVCEDKEQIYRLAAEAMAIAYGARWTNVFGKLKIPRNIAHGKDTSALEHRLGCYHSACCVKSC